MNYQMECLQIVNFLPTIFFSVVSGIQISAATLSSDSSAIGLFSGTYNESCGLRSRICKL